MKFDTAIQKISNGYLVFNLAAPQPRIHYCKDLEEALAVIKVFYETSTNVGEN